MVLSHIAVALAAVAAIVALGALDPEQANILLGSLRHAAAGVLGCT